MKLWPVPNLGFEHTYDLNGLLPYNRLICTIRTLVTEPCSEYNNYFPHSFSIQRALCLKALHWKSEADPPKPAVKCCIPFHKMVTHFAFEWTFFGIIIANVICIIIELSITDTLGLQVLSYLNYVFCFIYFVELILKIIGLRHHYFLSKWNWVDFILIHASIIDIVVELTVPMAMVSASFSPGIFRVVRVLRVGRALRLVKVLYVL